jgi:EamA domain-containing membrane protein RarD
MNALSRFLDAGLADAERRIARRLPPPLTDHPWVANVVASGTVARGIARVIAAGRASLGSSRVVALLRPLAASWREADWAAQRRGLGVLLLTAVATHLVLVLASTTPRGWLWLILPGMASAVGLLLLAAASRRPAANR